MDRWFETDRYQALVGACRTMDHAEQARIIDAAFQEGAARIARAEGNMTAFRNFCDKALAKCLEFDLRMLEVTVRAVMAGARH